jgi:hypothetical protein
MNAPWKATLAVLAAIGANTNEGDVVCRIGWPGTLMESRTVQCWIMRHRKHGVADLSAVLADAVDRARSEDRGLVLPELERKPIASPWSDAAAS